MRCALIQMEEDESRKREERERARRAAEEKQRQLVHLAFYIYSGHELRKKLTFRAALGEGRKGEEAPGTATAGGGKGAQKG
jgi:hypothetical protein